MWEHLLDIHIGYPQPGSILRTTQGRKGRRERGQRSRCSWIPSGVNSFCRRSKMKRPLAPRKTYAGTCCTLSRQWICVFILFIDWLIYLFINKYSYMIMCVYVCVCMYMYVYVCICMYFVDVALCLHDAQVEDMEWFIWENTEFNMWYDIISYNLV